MRHNQVQIAGNRREDKRVDSKQSEGFRRRWNAEISTKVTGWVLEKGF